MKSIGIKNMRGEFYASRSPDLDDVVVIANDVSRIIFPHPISAKGLMFGQNTEVICLGAARFRTTRLAGPCIFMGGLFCGSLDAKSSVVVCGDLASWIGDIVSEEGDICVTGQVICAGNMMARNGSIVVSDSIQAEGRIFSLNTWTGASGAPCVGMARMAANKASAAVKNVEGVLAEIAAPATP